MDGPLSSLKRAPSAKRTYAGSSKKKLSISRQSQEMSEEESSEEGHSETERSSRPLLRKDVMRSRSPKKVDVHLPGPGPSPKRNGTGDSSMKPPSLQHGRNASISSLRMEQSPKSSPKPKSSGVKHGRSQSLKSLGSIRQSTPDMDDSVSIADSAKSASKPRTTPASRIQNIQSHINCGDIEPHRAFCTKCDKWANLGKQQTYSVGMWLKHRARCDGQSEGTPTKPEAEEAEEADADGDGDDSSSVAASSVARSKAPIRRNAQERQAILEADPNIQTLEPYKVLCKICQRWVKLSKSSTYSAHNWDRHKRSCSDTVPSSRVSAAQRKLKLVNDPQIKSFDPHCVECALCREDVPLGHESEYNLAKWEEHKLQCSGLPAAHLQHQVPPPESIASTDNTAVASERTPPKPELKRPRDGDGDGEDEEKQPHNRPRKESYTPEDRPPPSRWGWFMMPFQAFMTGFRQGVGGSAPAQ
ncbi:hypothetical protein FIBSPDRAFT_828258 [Athelia psychrophila]|uniref:Uncharacterized protein n=1 Tax=Athelia psychrophila TaxID=1759441 RepID=A0A166HYG6_9AGAM|nr:hypothetical protein FIBSPDRAFT_828258 [Fibularhizoctonia sp. CBS 109695]